MAQLSERAQTAEIEEAVRLQMESRGIRTVDECYPYFAGDVVGIQREEGPFTIKSFGVDESGEVTHVNVYGGVKGSEAWRAFVVERIVDKPRKSRRKRKTDS